ncbi:uncharacterized protein SEPMUDRAFT_127822 [Sphaerulina musiva SO2202]|uniref:Stress-associated endoplasmic reticulum protein n=1 Tax=Sphaerulina musiva (strain SO2202) TaxID=692275 RepID=M3D0Y0_SPHMS|nr:uncharacterized protein SEPMUDRAFT_127822 [Sphaerulina musiva SO2202]EMF10148.1 hypothetical protein SEPMUDRAFT_127822 [Sphaerulina musiva SO2202]
MAQTPQQRRANNAYAAREQKKMGAPQEVRESLQAASTKAAKKVEKAPISKGWLYLMVFVVCGGLIFELLRIIFSYF